MKQEIRNILETPFTETQIKQRKGLWGKQLDYIEGHSVIHRLNEAFESDWSFFVTEHMILDHEVIVVGKLTVNGVVKVQFGSSNITRDSQTGKTLCLGDDLKGAATDSLKKCASLLGIGLHLYGDTNDSSSKNSTSSTTNNFRDSGNGGNGNNIEGYARDGQLITPKQMKYAFTLARRNNFNDGVVENLAVELFGKKFHNISKFQASELIQQLAA